MTDRPILFSAPMVRALLEGRKTQTRRIIKRQPALDAIATFGPDFLLVPGNVDLARFAVGDRLWVREAFRFDPGGAINDAAGGQMDYVEPHYVYRGDAKPGGWKPGIHMPRVASRLTLTVTEVQVERLQEITEADCIAEGPPSVHYMQFSSSIAALSGPMVIDPATPHISATPRNWYRELWDAINGAGAWDANPWVVAVTFTVERRNIDT